MKIFNYQIELTDDNDKDYWKSGIVISESKEKATTDVYNHYDNSTTDYVFPNVILTEITEINLNESKIIETR